jgi:hypothetical protein
VDTSEAPLLNKWVWLRKAVNHTDYLKGTGHQERIFSTSSRQVLLLKSVSPNIEHSKIGRIKYFLVGTTRKYSLHSTKTEHVSLLTVYCR